MRENNFLFYDASVKLLAEITPRDKLSLSGIYMQNALDFDIVNEDHESNDDLSITNQGASFSWLGTRGTKWSHSLNAFYTYLNSDYNYTETSEELLIGNSIRKNTVRELGVDLSSIYKINEIHSITLGYQLNNNEVTYEVKYQDDVSDDFTELDAVQNWTHSIYGNYILSFENKGHINLGLRGLHYSILERFYVEPRLNIEYPIVPSLRLKATAELRYQSTSQLVEFEDTELRLENNLWVHADDDDVPLLRSRQVGGGLLFTHKGWNFEVDS